MFIDKYKPQLLEEVIGNSQNLIILQKWIENWRDKNKTNEPLPKTTKNNKIDAKREVCALLSGISGIGKTLTVDLLIKKYDFNPIIINPDDKVDKDFINKTILPSTQIINSFSGKKNILVIHDIDCYEDYGFISSIVSCLKETKIPVISTCNNRYDQSLKPVISFCLDIKFQKPREPDILKFIKKISKQEKINITDSVLNQIITDSNCDIRNILNNLQLYKTNTFAAKNATNVSKDKTNNNIFDITKSFMSQNIEINEKQSLFWLNNDILPLMIHENYVFNNIKMKNDVDYLNNISDSIQCLSDIDLLEKEININSNWELLPYTAWFSIKSVSNCHAKAQIKFTDFFSKLATKKENLHQTQPNKKKQTKNDAVSTNENIEPKRKTKSKTTVKTPAKETDKITKPNKTPKKKCNLIIEK